MGTVVRESREERLQPKRDRKPLEKEQCTYYKERGHWPQEWLTKAARSGKSQNLGKASQNGEGVSPGGRQQLGRMEFRSQDNSESRGETHSILGGHRGPTLCPPPS